MPMSCLVLPFCGHARRPSGRAPTIVGSFPFVGFPRGFAFPSCVHEAADSHKDLKRYPVEKRETCTSRRPNRV